MCPARQQHELGSRNDRGEEPALIGTHRKIFLAVNHNRRYVDLGKYFTSVSPASKRVIVPGGGFGIG